MAIRINRKWQAVLGGLGIAAVNSWLLYCGAFAAMLPEELSLTERTEEILKRMFFLFPWQPSMLTVFLGLTGCTFLCVRGFHDEETVRGFIKGVLLSAAIAAVVIVFLLLLWVIRFG